MLEESKPDLIVGIDFGQTCTGVAYSLPSQGSDNIRWIQKWPGKSHINENKVPTILAYSPGHSKTSVWGFAAESATEKSQSTIREWFKTLLDPKNLERANAALPSDRVSHDDVRHWYRDYLTLLYDHIQLKLKAELQNFEWSNAAIEFWFSVPTTWSHQVVETYRELIGQAGFKGPANARHTVTISLTEPEAAAVYTSTAAPDIFKVDDVLVVCDAGGGTTDLSVLQVTDTMVDALSLKQLRQLDVVGGENIGSAAIDQDFEAVIKERLEIANRATPLGLDPAEVAWEMCRGNHYQNAKCEHGADDTAPMFGVRIPDLPKSYWEAEARIWDGEMHFELSELRQTFDRQVEKLFKLIDNQLRTLASKQPHKIVSHLVLSGGLGQSPYVQQRLIEHYADKSYMFANAEGMAVRVAPDPQMAVCKGLVADRLRKLKQGESVLGWRCCRASYGLICKELYSKKKPEHVGRKTEKDPWDRELYVPECIDWLVKKGEPVSIDTPISHNFKRKVTPGNPKRVFPTKIVVSYQDKESLPYQLEEGVEKLCEVESDLSSADETKFKERNKRLWQTGEHFFEVTYQVKVVIGPADLRFELWFNGQKLSKENSIKVEWAPSTAPSTSMLEPPKLPPPPIVDDGVLHSQKSHLKLRRFFSHTPPTTP